MSSVAQRIAIIRDFPAQLEQLTAHLTSQQLTTAYNAPEWTIAQNIHHCADAHMNAFIRCKLALTEDTPTIKPYRQNAWADLPDSTTHEVASSLAILQGLHQRWVLLLESVEDWSRAIYHPEQQRTLTLDDLLTMYANHCQAHLQQIREVMEKMG
ncbi:MAG: YfiT family bacillithiol transferase [Anaerolineae bacterium]